MKNSKILIADSYDISRTGVTSILEALRKFDLILAVKTGKRLLTEFKKHPSSVCIISSNIADSNIHDIMQELKKIQAEPRVIVLANSTDLSHLNQSLKAGVKGYLTKNISREELADSVLSVTRGEEAFDSSVSRLMVDRYTSLAKKSSPSRKGITNREKEILKLIVDGYTSTEIARILYISPRTVETHRSNLMNKLKIKNTAGLVRYALEEEDKLS